MVSLPRFQAALVHPQGSSSPSTERRCLNWCLRPFQDSRVPSYHENNHQGFRFPVSKLHSYIHKVPLHLRKNVGDSASIFALFKTLGFRLTMKAITKGFGFPVSKLHSYIHKVPLHLQQNDFLFTFNRTSVPQVLSHIIKTLGFRFTMKTIIKGLSSPFPNCTRTSTRFLFTFNRTSVSQIMSSSFSRH
jgi:hypothetical protein